VAAACSGEDLGDDDALSQGGSRANAATGGSSSGAGGSSMAPAAGSGGTSSMASAGAPAVGGSGGSASMPPMMSGPEPGETGRFVGITAAHNAVRAELDLPPLTWSEDMAELAQDWAETLTDSCGTLMHRANNRYGENIAARGATGNIPPMTGAEAVTEWAKEIDCWTYGAFLSTDSCNTACTDALNASGCGHYTQLVWETTQEVGCGYAQCQDGQFSVDLWVCNYNPPGNVRGRTPY
jgi:pathogenesis-related protein 1